MSYRLLDLESRISRLERSRRHWQRGAIIAVVALGSVVGIGAARQVEIQEEIRTRKLVVVDENDVPRVVIAQDPRTAESPAMPEAAIAAGRVDRILPLERIGPFLVELCRSSR